MATSLLTQNKTSSNNDQFTPFTKNTNYMKIEIIQTGTIVFSGIVIEFPSEYEGVIFFHKCQCGANRLFANFTVRVADSSKKYQNIW